MKDGIHPTYHEKAQVKCACGNTLVVGSTREKLQVEICSNCHPLYTGKEKLVDTAGRIEKFHTRRTKASEKPKKAKKATAKKSDSKPKKGEIKL